MHVRLYYIMHELSRIISTKYYNSNYFFFAGSSGVPDMTSISDIDEDVINRNLQIRYTNNHIYVSFLLLIISFKIKNHFSYQVMDAYIYSVVG